MAFSHVSSVSSVSLRSLLFNNFDPFEDCQPVSRRMSFNSGFSDAFASLNRGDIFLVRIEHTEAFFSVQPTRRWPVSPCLINDNVHCGHRVKVLFAGLHHLFSLCDGWVSSRENTWRQSDVPFLIRRLCSNFSMH